MKSKLKNLTHVMAVMMRRSEAQPFPILCKIQPPTPVSPQNETVIIQNKNMPAPYV